MIAVSSCLSQMYHTYSSSDGSLSLLTDGHSPECSGHICLRSQGSARLSQLFLKREMEVKLSAKFQRKEHQNPTPQNLDAV